MISQRNQHINLKFVPVTYIYVLCVIQAFNRYTSDETIPLRNRSLLNQNIVPETMEIHKHPHHVTHKKQLGEYALEFLMLFLAIFLGFVAENIRETSVERHQEKEYMRLMVEDLKKIRPTLIQWSRVTAF